MIDLQVTEAKVDLLRTQTSILADPTNPIAGPIVHQTGVPIADPIAIPIVDHSANNPPAAKSAEDINNEDLYYQEHEIVNGYSIQRIIGEGRYGIAYLAINDRYEKCVVKQLKKEMLKETKDKLFYEAQILQSLNSSNFPKFISKFKDESREGYLLEYMEGRVFEDLLTTDSYKFSKADIYQVGGQLLELIEVLHHNYIVHQDIRPSNVILQPNKELALIDFGLARYIDNNKYTRDIDYWYLGDFLIHLYYSTYLDSDLPERPWFEELDLSIEENNLLKKLMGIEDGYQNVDEIKKQLKRIIS